MREEGEGGGHGYLPNARLGGEGEIGFCPPPIISARSADKGFCGAEGATEKAHRNICNIVTPSFLRIGFVSSCSTIAVPAKVKKKNCYEEKFSISRLLF